jgi:hypothetical protein
MADDTPPRSPRELAPSSEAKEGGRRRVGRLLQSYYADLDIGAPQVDPKGLDGEAFDARDFAKQRIDNLSTPDLVKGWNEISVEVRGLDFETKMQVQENYSKFVTGTDLVRDIQVHCTKMEKQAETIGTSFNAIVTAQSGLHPTDAHSQRIESLILAKSRLDKARMLKKCPEQLERLVEANKPAQAVELYAPAPLWPALRAQCLPPMRAARIALERTLEGPDLRSALQAAGTLEKLDRADGHMEPGRSLRELFAREEARLVTSELPPTLTAAAFRVTQLLPTVCAVLATVEEVAGKSADALGEAVVGKLLARLAECRTDGVQSLSSLAALRRALQPFASLTELSSIWDEFVRSVVAGVVRKISKRIRSYSNQGKA